MLLISLTLAASAAHAGAECAPEWSPIAAPYPVTNGQVWALGEFDSGAGPTLIVGGFFTEAGGVPANRIASWDGTNWSPLGAGLDSIPRSLVVFDDGSGPAL